MMLSEKPRSPVSEHRKVTKSAMEKKRRARINSSLTELKTILAGIMSHKDERFEKMEKADILEMTVNYVRELQNKSSKKDKHVHQDGDTYRTGVNSCITEVIRYVTASDFCDTDTKTKLLDHLANRVNNISTTAKANCINSQPNNDLIWTPNVANVGEAVADVNNNVNNVDKPESDERLQPISICANSFPANTAQTNIQQSPLVIPISPLNTQNGTQDTQHIKQVSQTHVVVNSDVSLTKPQVFPIISQAQPQVVSNIPLTIFVSANFCTNVSGTTCVIPITLANPGADTGITLSPNTDACINDRVCTVENNSDENSRVCEMNKRQTDVECGISDRYIETTKETPKANSENHYHSESQNVYSDGVPTKCAASLEKYKSFPRNESVFQKSDSAFSSRHVVRRKVPEQYNREHSVWRPW